MLITEIEEGEDQEMALKSMEEGEETEATLTVARDIEVRKIVRTKARRKRIRARRNIIKRIGIGHHLAPDHDRAEVVHDNWRKCQT